MDEKRQEFCTRIETRFAKLNETPTCRDLLLESFDSLESSRNKLHDFVNAVIQFLILPRVEIVSECFGNSATVHHVANEVLLQINPTANTPGEAKLRIHYELFIPASSICYCYDYRITTSAANFGSEGWTRFTSKSFQQNKYCDWIENCLIQFVTAYFTRPRTDIGNRQKD